MAAFEIVDNSHKRRKLGRVAVRRDLGHQWTFKDSLSQFSGSDGKVDRSHIRSFVESMAAMRKHLVQAGMLNYPNWPS